MGVAFSHCRASWAYSGFNRVRMQLAEQVGLDFDRMVDDREYAKTVHALEHDAIYPLLNHSDCDGDLSPDECRTVAPRLIELAESWDNQYDIDTANELAAGMLAAADAGENLEFC